MPERQSSPGEVTSRPDMGGTENENGQVPAAQERASDINGGTENAVTVGEQVAGQMAASPPATEPGPVEPTADAPTGAEPVLDATTAVEIAQPRTEGAGGAVMPPAQNADARPAEQALSGPAAEPARAAPRPRPRARMEPDGPDGDESPTVRTAVAGSAPGDDEAPTDRTPLAGPNAPTTGPARDQSRAAAAAGVGRQTGTPAQGEAPTIAVRAAGAGPAAPAARPAAGHTASTAWFNPVDQEATQMIPRAAAPAAPAPAPAAPPTPADPATERLPITPSTTSATAFLSPSVDAATTSVPATSIASPPVPPPSGGPYAETDASGEPPVRKYKRRILLLTGMVGALALLYVGDLVINSGSVPRGVTVAGIRVGGLGLDEAEQRLRTEIEPRTQQPIQVSVGEARSEIDPAAAGLAVDWEATLAVAGSQPLNPITRITSFFTEREVGVVTRSDAEALDAALQELSPIVDKPPVEGSVRFDGTTPVPVDPVPGQQLDVPVAAGVLQSEWAIGLPVALPLTVLPPSTTPEDVVAAIDQVARPAVSAPVEMVGEGGASGTVTPEVIASALTFRADGGNLVPEINTGAVTDALKPQLASSERPGRDASLDFSSGRPVVVPSQDGRGVDYEASLAPLLDVLTGPGRREIKAVYGDQPAELTTEELNGLGITGVIGEFTTGGFAADSGRNIKRAAEQINGTIVKPGETFSLNGATEPRDASHGYVEAGIISDGHASRGIGGGVSQVATTLYNASYFAGMVDVAHKEHSFYISRYPAGREATVFEGAIDLKFRNDNPTGVLIQTVWTPSSLTVRLYGTKVYEVTSTPGPRTKPTSPNTVTIPAGEPCSPSQGAPGFTITDTRSLRHTSTGETRHETRTVRYNPSPIVVCGA
jgi:vancomycin resistance protein YoaR